MSSRFTLSAEQITDIFDTRRRLLSLSYLGEVIEVKNRRARVHLLGTDIDTDWMAFLKSNAKSFIQLEAGAKVQVFFNQGEISQGIILGALDEEGSEGDSEDPFQTFPDGTRVQYSLTDKRLSVTLVDGTSLQVEKGKLTFSGDIVIGGNLEVAGDAGIKGKASVTGDLKAESNVLAAGEVSAGPLKVKLSNHTHGNPEGGTVGTPI